jgi:hypothetical protein
LGLWPRSLGAVLRRIGLRGLMTQAGRRASQAHFFSSAGRGGAPAPDLRSRWPRAFLKGMMLGPACGATALAQQRDQQIGYPPGPLGARCPLAQQRDQQIGYPPGRLGGLPRPKKRKMCYPCLFDRAFAPAALCGASTIPQRALVSVRVEVGRLCDGRGRWSNATALFWCQNVPWPLARINQCL